jgi:hypothetical protein
MISIGGLVLNFKDRMAGGIVEINKILVKIRVRLATLQTWIL